MRSPQSMGDRLNAWRIAATDAVALAHGAVATHGIASGHGIATSHGVTVTNGTASTPSPRLTGSAAHGIAAARIIAATHGAVSMQGPPHSTQSLHTRLPLVVFGSLRRGAGVHSGSILGQSWAKVIPGPISSRCGVDWGGDPIRSRSGVDIPCIQTLGWVAPGEDEAAPDLPVVDAAVRVEGRRSLVLPRLRRSTECPEPGPQALRRTASRWARAIAVAPGALRPRSRGGGDGPHRSAGVARLHRWRRRGCAQPFGELGARRRSIGGSPRSGANSRARVARNFVPRWAFGVLGVGRILALCRRCLRTTLERTGTSLMLVHWRTLVRHLCGHYTGAPLVLGAQLPPLLMWTYLPEAQNLPQDTQPLGHKFCLPCMPGPNRMIAPV